MRIKRTLAKIALCSLGVAALTGAGVHRAAAAELGDPAYCPYGSVSGTGQWLPGVGPTLTPQAMQMNLQATCIGFADEGGSYTMTLAGSSNEGCGAGTGSGTLTGSAPEGAMSSGTYTFFKVGIHYYISGSYVADSEDHTVQLWIDVLPSAGTLCSYGSAPLIGHGAIAEMLNVTVTPPSVGAVSFAASTTLLTPIQPVGGAGAYTLSTAPNIESAVPGVCEMGVVAGVEGCTLNAMGMYVSIVAGTGMTGGAPLGQTDTASITTADRSITVHYGIVFAAGHGIITGTWSASDGSSGTAAGYVDITPVGMSGAAITRLAAVGELVLG